MTLGFMLCVKWCDKDNKFKGELTPDGHKLCSIPRKGRSGGCVALFYKVTLAITVVKNETTYGFDSLTACITSGSRLVFCYHLIPNKKNRMTRTDRKVIHSLLKTRSLDSAELNNRNYLTKTSDSLDNTVSQDNAAICGIIDSYAPVRYHTLVLGAILPWFIMNTNKLFNNLNYNGEELISLSTAYVSGAKNSFWNR